MRSTYYDSVNKRVGDMTSQDISEGASSDSGEMTALNFGYQVDIYFKNGPSPLKVYMSRDHSNILGIHYKEYLENKTSMPVNFSASYAANSGIVFSFKIDFRQVELLMHVI